jgi:phospholipase/carboxylesterase
MSGGGLAFETGFPEAPRDGAPVAILLHGRGSHMGDLQGLRPGLPPETLVVTPQAPHPGAPWGYGPGWAWYRYVAEDRVVGETLQESLEALDAFMDALESILPVTPGPIFLGGFSQGGTTSLAWALTRPGRVAGVLNFSGFLADDEAVELSPASTEGLRVFWGHGRQDPAIPFALGEKGRNRLAEAGVDLTTSDHDIGHWIDPAELAAAGTWMRSVTGG